MRSTGNYLALLAAIALTTCPQAAAVEPEDYVRRDFVFDAKLFSYVPGEGIEGYHPLGSGSGMPTASASVGLGVTIDGIQATATLSPRLKEGRFLVTIDVEPKERLDFEEQTLDFTDLKPVAIRLAITDSGRVYQLNLTPRVQVTDNTPRRLNVSELHLHNWQFPDSPILVNDAIYAGRLGCASSPVAFVDISGVARVEFSLYQLTESEPWGTLHQGVVTLTHPVDKTKIQISNVRNGGPHAVDLPGGPYRVWVRWSDPTYTVEQHWDALLSELRERILESSPNAEGQYLLDFHLTRDPSPWIHSGGVRGLRPGEQVDRAD